MACTAAVRQEEGVIIVDLAGRITLGDAACTVRDTVRGLISRGERQILLNLQQVTYIDSAGLGELVGTYATMINRGGQIKMLHADNKVRDVLRATRLSLVFENFTDEAAALRSFDVQRGATP
jgi:anti-sigma B factor antagonist